MKEQFERLRESGETEASVHFGYEEWRNYFKKMGDYYSSKIQLDD